MWRRSLFLGLLEGGAPAAWTGEEEECAMPTSPPPASARPVAAAAPRRGSRPRASVDREYGNQLGHRTATTRGFVFSRRRNASCAPPRDLHAPLLLLTGSQAVGTEWRDSARGSCAWWKSSAPGGTAQRTAAAPAAARVPRVQLGPVRRWPVVTHRGATRPQSILISPIASSPRDADAESSSAATASLRA